MYLEDELVDIRRRRAELERALLHLDDTLAITLIKAVIEDMDVDCSTGSENAACRGMSGRRIGVDVLATIKI
jgi:hypothetical protein